MKTATLQTEPLQSSTNEVIRPFRVNFSERGPGRSPPTDRSNAVA